MRKLFFPSRAREAKKSKKRKKKIKKKITPDLRLAKNETEVFNASSQRAKSSFFAIMRPRLRKQNRAKYFERSALDRDLMILQRALKNKVPLNESND